MRLIILSRSEELYSTRSLFNAARKKNHFVRVVDHLHCDILLQNGGNEVYFNGRSLKDYDAIIPRIGHTATAYGAAVIRQFESMNVFTTINSEPLLRARDKLSGLQLLSAHGIPIPKTLYINNQFFLRELSFKIDEFPKIIKLVNGTHGIGVLKVDDQSMMEAIMEAMIGTGQKVLLQEFIKESAGVDIRVFIVDDQIIACMMRIAEKGEFRSNLHRGASSIPVELSPDEADIALKAVRCMGLKVAGVDMLRTSSGPILLEVNASPGLEGIEKTTHVDVAGAIIEFIERNLQSSV